MARKGVRTIWIGDPESGKTSLLTSYTKNVFPQQYVPSLNENYTVQVNNFLYGGKERNINLNISTVTVDSTVMNGEEYEPQSDVVVIVCDWKQVIVSWIRIFYQELDILLYLPNFCNDENQLSY